MRAEWRIAACALLAAAVAIEAAAQERAISCTASELVRVPELPEASGIAIVRGGDRVWSHNDSGAPVIFALDGGGKAAARVTINGARVTDWEAIATGPCPSGSCLYIADIGDNNAKRSSITIYRVPEPKQSSGTVNAEVFTASYPDGAHDAETLLITPDGTLVIVTKGDTGPVAVYKFPKTLTAQATMQLERVGKPLWEKPNNRQRITDGAISPDGKLVVLRTRNELAFYSGPEFLRGEFKVVGRFDTSKLGEPQGEGVTFGDNNVVYIAGEGGGKKAPGTLGRLSCTL